MSRLVRGIATNYNRTSRLTPAVRQGFERTSFGTMAMQIHPPQAVPPLNQLILQGPWPWLSVGAAGCAGALAWLLALEALKIPDAQEMPARLVLLFLSLLAVGVGIVRQPSSARVLGAAAGVGVLGWLALGPWPGNNYPWHGFGFPWDSARLLILVLTVVAAVAALLMLLPRIVRRGVVSFLVLFHFVGMLSTVFSVPPAPWLATNLWAYVFRPYLDFVYLNNAYHFYSPDPGPPNLMWFRIEYNDGSYRWLKIPNKEDFPTAVNYQRRLSLTESIHQPKVVTDSNLMGIRQERRVQVGLKWPAHPTVALAAQFREPNAYSRRMIENYVRWVAQTDSYQTAERAIVTIRLYRVVHDIVEGPQFARGVDPLDRWMYRPYYQGEYSPEGKLLNPNDPLLYWLIPIVLKDDRLGWAPPNPESLTTVTTRDRTYEVYDFLKLHAGDYQ